MEISPAGMGGGKFYGASKMTTISTYSNVTWVAANPSWIEANPWSARASRQETRPAVKNNICQVRCTALVSSHLSGIAPSQGEAWTEESLAYNKARANREMDADESGLLAFSKLERGASRPNSGLRVQYSSATAQFVPSQDSMKSVEAAEALRDVEQGDLPDGLDLLDNWQLVEAERKLSAGGSETTKRAQAIASMVGISHDQITGYVLSLMKRVPQTNRWDYRQDLEQAIWTHLTHRKKDINGDWDIAKMECQVAYKRWYSRHSKEAQLGVEAEQRAISLERAYAKDQQGESESTEADVTDQAWIDWEDAVGDNLDLLRLVNSLPENIRDMVERKANGEPQNATERKRLQRWLKGGSTKKLPHAQTNKDIVTAVLKGTHLGAIVWHKPIR
jgi:hypothetical protein